MLSPMKIFLVLVGLTGLTGLLASPICTTPDQLSDNPDDVRFYFYPRQGNPVREQEIVFNNSESLANSAFDRTAEKTVILIHGFTDNRTTSMPRLVGPAYMESNRNYNLIVVEWGLLSGSCYVPFTDYAKMYAVYTQVVFENIPIVANRTAQFIHFLNIDASKVHVVGHSLGAHVSGQAGKNSQAVYNYILARITGLDPAGPSFTPSVPTRNLDRLDAQFVDVIHSNMGASGDTSIDGDVDFYVNGGFVQPGCVDDLPTTLAGVPQLNTVTEVVNSSSCSHQFAPLLYAASLKKVFRAFRCVDTAGNVLTGLNLKICLGSSPNRAILGVDCPTTTRGLYSIKTGNPP